MRPETTLTWSWLNVLTMKRTEALREVYGDLDEALEHVGENLLKSLGCREETITKTLVRFGEFSPEVYQQALEKRGTKLLSFEDPSYPSRLKEIPDAPVFLSYRGDLSVVEQPCIALVGTRRMSTYGRRVTERFVGPLVQAGMVTVSGLAQGIDATVALETLSAGGKTVAVFGHGLGTVLPTLNARLSEEIVEKGGLLLTEFPLDHPPDTYTFPARNRIIAALSLGTVVLEAPQESGALITADLALDYGREVFAVPGQVFDGNYEGCHTLITEGRAKLVVGPEDVLQELGIVHLGEGEAIRPSYVPVNPEEETILHVLSSMPQHMNDVVEKAKMEVTKASTALTLMELKGVVKNMGQGMWVKNS